MLNNKMISLGKSRSVIREIFEYAKIRKSQIGEDKVFDYSIGNPSIPSPEEVNNVIKELTDTMDPVKLHGYTSAQGDLGVRTTISNYINKLYNAGATPDLIYMTCGAAASLTIALNAIINKGDEVIVLAPFFPEYRVFVEKSGAELKIVKCRNSDFQLDLEAISNAINENTKAIIINSPNNPSGAVFNKRSLEKLSDILEEKQKQYNSDIYIIADEPYRELVYGDIEVPYIPLIFKNTIVCYSYSKSLSLAGERIGYIFVSPENKDCNDLYAGICGAGRALGFVCAPSLMQYTVGACNGMTSDIAQYKKNRDLLYNYLVNIGYEVINPDGAFYLFVKALESDAVEFCEKAKKYELLPVPSDSFGVNGYVRICYCVKESQIINSLPSFKALYEDYKEK